MYELLTVVLFFKFIMKHLKDTESIKINAVNTHVSNIHSLSADEEINHCQYSHLAESLCRSPETITTLLTGYRCSVAKLRPTLCNPMYCSTPGFTIFQNLLKVMSTESVTPSNHLIPYCPLLFLPSVFPSIRVFSNELALCIMWPEYFSFRISLSSDYSGLISFRIDYTPMQNKKLKKKRGETLCTSFSSCLCPPSAPEVKVVFLIQYGTIQL